MPPLSQHQSATTTKLLLIGDSGTGKTGALASLADAGYNLRILDLDNGLDLLTDLLTSPKSKYSPDAISRIQYISLTEKMRAWQGKVVPAASTVWKRTIDALSHWKDGETDLGDPHSWTSQDILVIDSLSMLSTAAYNWHLSMNGKLQSGVSGFEYQRVIGQAQSYVESVLQLLYDTSIKCNVVVISHVTYVDEGGFQRTEENKDTKAPQQGWPSSLGKALAPRIPRYFNTVLQAKITETGRRIFTQPQGVVNLKSSAPLRVKASYPIETGLADYFKAVREQTP